MSSHTGRSLQRVVTGHDENGKAVITMRGAPALVKTFDTAPGLFFNEIWNTPSVPAIVENGHDPTLDYSNLPPPPGGTLIRIAQIPPESSTVLPPTEAERRMHFAEMGSPGSATGKSGAPHALMHRTETIDYGIVIEGALTLVLDDSEVELHAGDVVVQRGTNHAWSNRSGAPVLIAFVLVDGRYSSDVAASLKHFHAEAGA